MEHGDLFERSFKTGKGTIRLLAEIDVQGTRLHLKDVVVFEESGKHVTGLMKEALAARTQLINAAIALGFKAIRITGIRTATSSSANPGHAVDLLIDLTRYKSP